MRWFRLYTDILEDPKMYELSEFEFAMMIKMMALASKLDDGGRIAVGDSALKGLVCSSTRGRTAVQVLPTLFRLNIISSPKLPFTFLNWEKRQYKSDDSSGRVQKHREMKRYSNGGVTPPDTDTDTETEKDLKPIGHSSSNHDFFERFWSQYPRKEKKKNAVEAWARLNLTDEDFYLVMASLARQKMSDQWTRDGGKFIPHPTTWLNGRRWEDEGIQGDYATTAPGSPATKFEKNMAVLDEALKKAKGEGSNGGQGNGGERLEGVGNNLSRAERERGVRGNLPGASGGSAGRGSHKGGQGVPAAVPVLSDDSGDQGAGGADSSGVEP
jgi:hypothetical protein